jgi:hypothetical protein
MKTGGNYRLGLAWVVRLILAMALMASGLGKFLDGREAARFLVSLTNSHPVAEKWADAFIIGLSILEIALAGALLHHRSVRIGLAILSGILALFSGILAVALVRDVSIDSCGCFGGLGGEMSLERALLRNLSLLAASGCYLLLDSTPHADVKTHPTDPPKVL